MRIKIKKMPDKKTLEAFLGDGHVKVIFDIKKGIFEWGEPRKKKK